MSQVEGGSNGTLDADADTANKSNKPSSSKFKQQTLWAWQPIITAGTVFPIFTIIGIIFIAIGVGLFFTSKNVQEIKIDYTDCAELGSADNCADKISRWHERNGAVSAIQACHCEKEFEIGTNFEGDVNMYYALTNFYQNHRRYVRSRDDSQLWGVLGKPSSDCGPFDVVQDDNAEEKWYWPCGAIANSMFQDVIDLYQVTDSAKEPVSLIRKGIAWESDKINKFKNPCSWPKNATFIPDPKFIKPKSWIKDPFQLDPENPDNNGLLNEDFIVWMRTAALPSFRKLYRKLNRTQEGFEGGLPAGKYILDIQYSYPVRSYQGTKSIVFTTTSLIGSKNPFLGIAYMVAGCVCLFLGILFIFIHLKYGRTTEPSANWLQAAPVD